MAVHDSQAAPPYGHSPTLARLLDEPDLELKLVAGSPERVGRVMNGIHLTEILEVDRWLAAGWVMMTTGVLLRRKPAAQRALVRDLDRIGATGLCYCVDIVTRNVPAALLDEARRLDFPLFAMPLHIRARDVATRANRMILTNDDTLFQQWLSSQDLFFEGFDSVTQPDWLPERQLIDNLASLLGLPVVYRSADDVAPARDDTVGQILLTAPTHAPITRRTDDADLLIVPARVGALFVGWIVVSLPPDSTDDQPALKSTGAVARLVALAVLSRKRTTVNAHAIRQELMGQILGLTSRARTPDELLEQLGRDGVLSALQDVGFQPGEPIRALLVESDVPAALDAVLEDLDAREAPYVFAKRDLRLTVIASLPAEAITTMVERNGRVTAGVGSESGIGQLARSLEQARAALEATARQERSDGRTKQPARCLVFDDLPISSWMLYRNELGPLTDKASQEIAALRSNRAVFETLVTYFANDMDVARCAETLFIHPNSVRYRLGRVEQALQISLQEPAAISNLYLALRIFGEL